MLNSGFNRQIWEEEWDWLHKDSPKGLDFSLGCIQGYAQETAWVLHRSLIVKECEEMGGSHYSNLTAGESPPLQILEVFRYQQVANIEARLESEPIAKALRKFSRFTPFAFCEHSACGISEWITCTSVPGSGSSFSSSGLYVHRYRDVGLESGLIPVAPIACPGPCLQWVWMLGFSKISSVGFVSKCLRYIQAYCQHSLSLGEAKNSANDSVVYVQHNR